MKTPQEAASYIERVKTNTRGLIAAITVRKNCRTIKCTMTGTGVLFVRSAGPC